MFADSIVPNRSVLMHVTHEIKLHFLRRQQIFWVIHPSAEKRWISRNQVSADVDCRTEDHQSHTPTCSAVTMVKISYFLRDGNCFSLITKQNKKFEQLSKQLFTEPWIAGFIRVRENQKNKLKMDVILLFSVIPASSSNPRTMQLQIMTVTC